MRYYYNRKHYDTIAEVEAAVTALKNRLDNNPTDWVSIKLLSGDSDSGWIVPPESLNDSDILNNISGDNRYNVSAINDGDTYTAVTATQANEMVGEMRNWYASWIQANTITEQYAPTNEDMSVYAPPVNLPTPIVDSSA